MAVLSPEAHKLFFRTVRMRVPDWDKFQTAMQWLMDQSRDVKGGASVIYYRSVQDPSMVCIVEYWESPEAMAGAYELMGNIPWEFVERAGNPEYIEDLLWQPSETGELAIGSR